VWLTATVGSNPTLSAKNPLCSNGIAEGAGLGVLSGGHHQSSHRVSEVVETHSGKSSAVDQAPKGPAQPLGADRPAQSVGEYKSLIIPVATRDKPLSRLLRSLTAQQLDQLGDTGTFRREGCVFVGATRSSPRTLWIVC
jgi:hypothetical protein